MLISDGCWICKEMVGEISCALVTEKTNDDVGNVGSGGEYILYIGEYEYAGTLSWGFAAWH